MARSNGASAAKILKQLGDKATKAAHRALAKGADIVAAEAKRRVPVKTGKLRDSIHTGSMINRQGKKVVQVIADATDKKGFQYGRVVEYARGGKNAFLNPALEAKAPEVKKGIADAVKEAVRKR